MMEESDEEKSACEFVEDDELRWHQLGVLRRIVEQRRNGRESPVEDGPDSTRDSWGLSDDIEPYPWQEQAVESWEENDRQGVAKVVTGAGKTVMALICVEAILREDPEHHVSVVVPTKVLMDQWYQELTETLNLPEEWVGRRSGDYADDHTAPTRVVVYVINSARHDLGKPLDPGTLSHHHFLIVDECHRAGSPENSRIFNVPYRWSLGLSATPERDPDEVAYTDEEFSGVIREEIGPIIYSLTFEEALEQEIIPPFELIHCAVPLTSDEREKHERLSRQITETRKKLREHPDFISKTSQGLNQFAAIQSMATNGTGRGAELAEKFQFLTGRRKELLYRAGNRMGCFRNILEEEMDAGASVMAFHERIKEVNRLYCDLVREDLPVVMEHTQLTPTQRDRSLELYLRNVAPILLSVRALVEGVDAPATDVGVIVASSSSPRQKIQSIGRVLRRYPGKDTSRIYNLYVEDSADEYIFKRVDFADIVGAQRIEYRRWNGPDDWEELDAPPYTPAPRDDDLTPEQLVIGQSYPGREEGLELSMDSQGNIYREILEDGTPYREYVQLPERLMESIRDIRHGGGPVRITPREKHVLVPARASEGEWELFYAGSVEESLEWESEKSDHVTLVVSSKHGGSVRLKRRDAARYDPRSPASREIQAAVDTTQAERDCDIHRVNLTSSGEIKARVEGTELVLGQLEKEDGWPFGASSFEELKSFVEEES